MKKILGLVVVIGALLVSIPIVGSTVLESNPNRINDDLPQLMDRLNVLIKEEPTYVLTSSKYETKVPQGGYSYAQQSVSQSGKEYPITFYAPDNLREGAFLKLNAKGRYIESWEEVHENEIDAATVNKLKALNEQQS